MQAALTPPAERAGREPARDRQPARRGAPCAAGEPGRRADHAWPTAAPSTAAWSAAWRPTRPCWAARRLGAPVSLLMIDIDHFKRVNDSYGHAFGDQVLRAVAQVLKALTPEGGLAARVGGEEFALLLPGMPLAQARGAGREAARHRGGQPHPPQGRRRRRAHHRVAGRGAVPAAATRPWAWRSTRRRPTSSTAPTGRCMPPSRPGATGWWWPPDAAGRGRARVSPPAAAASGTAR